MSKPANFEKNNGVIALARELQQSVQTISRKMRSGKDEATIRREAAEWKESKTKLKPEQRAAKRHTVSFK